MIREVLLPQVELTMESATVTKIMVKEGDKVAPEQCLMEVETQKAISEIPSPFAGIVQKICVKEGDVIPEKSVLCLIADSAEEIASAPPETVPATPESSKLPPGANSPRTTPLARKMAQDLGVRVETICGTGPGGKVTRTDINGAIVAKNSGGLRAAPASRKLAKELGIDLKQITGTGPLGRIKVGDVRSFRKENVSPAEGEWTPMASSRLAFIAQMQKSLAEIPQITITRQIDVTPLAIKQEGITFTHRLVFKLAAALRAHRALCTMTDGRRLRIAPVSVAIAIDIPGGLLAPVIRQADLGATQSIAARLKDYRSRAENRSLKNDELRDGPFALTNLGMLGVDFFTPFVFSGQTAVLAVGRTAEVAAGRKTAWFCLAVDHRVVDGAEAARFLETLQREILS